MLVSAAITVVRALTNQDGANNDQLDDTTQLLPLFQLETEILRAQIAELAPRLYETTTADTVVPPAAFPKPADFKRVIRVERKSSLTPTRYIPVEPSDGLRPDLSWLSWEERQSTLTFAPTDLVAGTYRLVYEPIVATLTLSTAIPVPPGGFEMLLIQRICAHVRTRVNEDPSGHLQIAVDTWNRLKGTLKHRTGEHPKPGMKKDRIR